MYAPFSALHPTPSRLTSTTSTSGTAATESMDVSASASDDVLDGNAAREGDEEDYVDVGSAECADIPGLKPRRSNSSGSHDSDLDRKMPAKSPTKDKPPSAKPKSTNKDSRFLCSICLDTVSDEPVVTRCGHLYCWACLYQWLEPGMFLSEYTAAFGGVAPVNPSGSRNRGLNFLNDMTYSDVNANHRPFNPSGGRYNESRRCCPVCKADCTVDSVIPVYIHHSLGSVVGDDESIGLDDSVSMSGGVVSPVAAAASRESPETDSNTRYGSPNLRGACSSFDTDPTSNVGLRQRRRASPHGSTQPVLDSPVTETSTFVGTPRSSNTVNGLNDTPIHRNGSQTDDDSNRAEYNATSQVPARPVPTSPWATNRTVHPTTPTPPASAPQHVDADTTGAPIGTSSPFRLALRPRRQPFLSSSPSVAYHPQHHGGLTSVLMGIVDTIDNLAASNSQVVQDNPVVPTLHRSDGGMGGIGRASEHTTQDARMPHALSDEESSLEMAREFLSRLLLMLACFVVLCLLLF